jgi:N utilization substance protein B
MLNRRHIRIKVMQSIYVMHQQQSDQLDKEEKFLLQSIENSQDLYLVMLSIFNELQLKEKAYLELASKKHLATKEEQNPNFKFVNKEAKTIGVENGLIKLHDAGTGFMMISREAILKMIKAYPELKYNNDVNIANADLKDHFYALFDTMIDPIDRRYLSEDYTFCRRWQEIGGDVWLDPSISLNHYGHFCFQGNPEAIISFGPPAGTPEKPAETLTLDLPE